ncbi:hypothetical protein DERP_015440 [Dermatophagoides pteronyssinus]|uniref:Uncharacterized protein n=1 Tax=Dermatophagoides pteronyssinus TaxID=6956 RepID=A0ABQ8JFH5_DERPT|nr:hypothetical protein DERP_015440 [Dermatophagoides pteronyssinus]
MWIVFVYFPRFLFMLVWFGKFNVFTFHEMIWRVFFLRPNYRHNSDMINVDRICIFKILVWFGKFNVFNILELIWRVFYLRPNYRHYSDMINVDHYFNMINVDCICISKILDNVRLKFAVLTVLELIWRHFCLQPNYQHDSGMVNVVLFLIFKILVHVSALSSSDQIIDLILI